MNFTKFEKRANPLLERTEISAIFDIENTSFNRREASTLIAKEAKINPDTVYSIKLSNSAGSHYVSGLFYVYKDENTAKMYLPKFILNRNVPKIEEKPAEEAKAEEKPAEKAKAEEKPAEKAKAEEKPAEEAKAEEKPAKE